jgi:outer membrane cobalamin receptor
MICLALPALGQQNPPADPAKLEPLRESITVTETVEAESPASIEVVTRSQIEQIPGVNLDDRLRNIPGFSMFRRSSSLVSHPTTQGVSLRGLGSSGASRTVLLWDGIPVNSPFGGWIYWNRLDPELMSRVELSRGASTSVWGNQAMGGALNMFSRETQPLNLIAGVAGGNAGQVELTGGFSNLWRQRWGASAYVRAFRTDGYFIVPSGVRGAADTRAGANFVASNVRLDYLSGTDRAFLRADVLAEERENGTVVQTNSTGLGTVAASWTRQLANDNVWLSAFHTRENFHAQFSGVAADRNTETLTTTQESPSEASGFAGLWRHNASSWNAVAGGDFLHVDGYSRDNLWTAAPGARRFGQGSRNANGYYGQWNGAFRGVQVFLGSRIDYLGNGRAFYSPSGGFTTGRGIWRLRGSLYRSFRAPTLNELYRAFRVGNALTNANPDLKPERLFGAEIGVDLIGETRRLSVTLYRNSLADVVTNVTLSTTPALITRQRQNVGGATSYGAEVTLRENWGTHWQGQLSYLYVDSQFNDGLRVPQIARHQGSAQVSWVGSRAAISAGLRAYSSQFENDLNTLVLGGFATVQLAAKYQLRESLYATAEIDNLTDRQYLIGLPGIPQIGSPLLFRLGLRWDGPIN